jgi:small subunit ribosomal protein S7
MPRKGAVSKREILPDPKYHDRMVSKFVNSMMEDGKRSLAERVLYDALDIVAQRGKDEALGLFRKAIENVKPVVEVRSRRVGGATYQVPVEVRPSRRASLAMRWIVQQARSRGEKSMEERLAGELLDASANRGAAVKKREDTHRMAEANKAFAHYRW